MVAASYDYYSAIGDAPIGFLSLGSPMIVAAAPVGVTGTGAAGTLTSSIGAVPTGLAASAVIGTPTALAGSQVIVFGLAATAAINVPFVMVGPNTTLIHLTGLHVTAAIGAPSVKPQPHLIGQFGTAAIGIPAGVVFAEGMFLTDLLVTSIPQPVSDVALNVRWSDTEGYSWSDSVQRTIGQTGAYLTSIQIRRLGMSRRGRVFELSWDSPSPTALMGVSIMFEDSST